LIRGKDVASDVVQLADIAAAGQPDIVGDQEIDLGLAHAHALLKALGGFLAMPGLQTCQYIRVYLSGVSHEQSMLFPVLNCGTHTGSCV
jgi:hypothetical protein